jgi:hypothetical protein
MVKQISNLQPLILMFFYFFLQRDETGIRKGLAKMDLKKVVLYDTLFIMLFDLPNEVE